MHLHRGASAAIRLTSRGARFAVIAGGFLGATVVAGCHGIAPYTGSPPPSVLVNTYWQLTRVAGKPVHVQGEHRQPYILLTGNNNRLQGFDGCNNLAGGYHRDGHKLQFKQIAQTRMACPNRMDLARALLNALDHTRHARIGHHQLTLTGAKNKPLATFAARVEQFESG